MTKRITLIGITITIAIAIFMFFTIQSKKINDEHVAEHLPVLMYHTFEDEATFPNINITQEEFKAQLTYLKNHGYHSVTSEQMEGFLTGEAQLPEKAFVITIDDGYKSVYENAFPVLKEMNMPAIFFVITSHIESGERFDVEMASWEQLKEMSDSGLIAIENHTHDLHWRGKGNEPGYEAMTLNMTKSGKEITDEERSKLITEDLNRATELIDKHIGRTPNMFSYPYGVFDDFAEEAVFAAGLKINFTTEQAVNYFGDGTTRIKRFNVNSDISPERILKFMEEGE